MRLFIALLFGLVLPLSATTTFQFSNGTAMNFPVNQGPVDLYPSPIAVTGAGGNVTIVTLSLNDINLTQEDEFAAVLADPSGNNLLVVRDFGQGSAIGITWTFSDSGTGGLCGAGAAGTGTYKPGQNCSALPDSLPAPAPAGPYGLTLSGFNGFDPNGTWNLYVATRSNSNIGSVAQGWTLNITTDLTVPETSACWLVAAGVLAMTQRRIATRKHGTSIAPKE
jgi:hypothetical protein